MDAYAAWDTPARHDTRADHPGGYATLLCLGASPRPLTSLAPPTGDAETLHAATTRRRDDRQPTFRACPTHARTRWRPDR
ncbi:MAG: hypothetical protein QOJ06_2322, partial [Pseudonocardiales bacterium]|nr:hypothetical protein [Pseudonocardiales bacterium]